MDQKAPSPYDQSAYRSSLESTPQAGTPQPLVTHPPPVYQTFQQPGQPGQFPGQFPLGQPVSANGSRQWQSSLFDCSPIDTCLLSTFLPCILIGRTSERIRDPTMQTAETLNMDCMCLCAIQYATGCGWLYVMMKRTDIRERFGIEGSTSEDCCSAYLCPCCALIQQDNEVHARLSPAVSTQGYQTQPPMTMPNSLDK